MRTANRIKDLLRAVATLLVLLLPASGATPNPVETSGYTETTSGRALLKSAIESANSILVSSSAYRLIASWEAVPSELDQSKAIRVYLVEPTSPNFMVQVPYSSCNCILLQKDAYREYLARYSTKLQQMMKIDERHLLAFILLHEVGHVERSDPGQYDGDPSDYNYDDTEQKRIERAADEFAATALVAAAQAKNQVLGFINSMNVQLAITNASWNLMALRLLEGFGGTQLCAKVLFADRKASHPNFELRILTVNDIIAGQRETRELLKAFEACRKVQP